MLTENLCILLITSLLTTVRLHLLFIARCSIQLSAITDHWHSTPIFLYLFLLIIMVCVVIGHSTD